MPTISAPGSLAGDIVKNRRKLGRREWVKSFKAKIEKQRQLEAGTRAQPREGESYELSQYTFKLTDTDQNDCRDQIEQPATEKAEDGTPERDQSWVKTEPVSEFEIAEAMERSRSRLPLIKKGEEQEGSVTVKMECDEELAAGCHQTQEEETVIKKEEDEDQDLEDCHAMARAVDTVAVDVGVGASRETFKIPKSHAMAKSRYFHHVLRISDGEVDQSIYLPDVEGEIFAYFYDFLWIGTVAIRNVQGDVTGTLHKDLRYSKDWDRLAKAWLLGEQLQSIPFRDAVIDAIIRKICESDETPLDLYRLLYRCELKQKKSCIERLLLDIALWTWKDEIFENELIRQDLQEHSNFFFDLTKILAAVRWQGVPEVPFYERNVCFYHEHVEERRPCYRELQYGSDETAQQGDEAPDSTAGQSTISPESSSTASVPLTSIWKPLPPLPGQNVINPQGQRKPEAMDAATRTLVVSGTICRFG